MKAIYLVAGAIFALSVLYISGAGFAADIPESGKALIVAPVVNGDQSALQKALDMRAYLLSRGWSDSDIVFLTGGLSEPFVDGPATPERVMEELDNLATYADGDTYVQINIYDHAADTDGLLVFHLEGGDLSVDTFVQKVNSITCDWMFLELSTNYAENVAKGIITKDSHIIMCSHAENQVTEFNYFNIVKGLTNPEADTNGDGSVSLEEAFYFEYNVVTDLSDGEQTPVMYDNA